MPLAPAVTSTRKPLSSRSMTAPRCRFKKVSAGETPAGQNEIRGTADVGFYSLKRRFAVAGGDGLAHIGVKPDRVALRQPFGIGAQIEIDHRPGFKPEGSDDFDKDRRVRRLVNRKM